MVDLRSTSNSPAGSPLVLFVEDDLVLRDQLASLARRSGFRSAESGSVDEALAAAARLRPSCIVSDLKMPGAPGSQIPERLRAQGLQIPVVILTGEAAPEQVTQLRASGMDCLVKPVGPQVLIELLNRLTALERHASTMVPADVGVVEIVGRSAAMQRLREQIDRIGRTRATVLLEGPSGSGKELIARALHHRQRSSAPFVVLNSAAVSAASIESTLFGHERGAFAGAVRSARGAFEQAHQGTLLLDEVGAMRLDLQAKLLRVMQERSIQRLGGETVIPVDARIIATTNRDLVTAVERNEFREDLYYCLNVMHVRVPSLDERREDIPLIVSHLLERLGAQHGVVPPVLSADALSLLCDMEWPGNVRQLANAIERTVLHADSAVVDADLLATLCTGPSASASRPVAAAVSLRRDPPAWARGLEVLDLEAVNHAVMQEALRRTRGNRRQAAQLLGVHVRTLRRHLAERPLEELQ